MKLSAATLAAILALSTVSEGRVWSCSRGSGGTNQNLKNAVDDFNKLFGKNRLKTAKHQCYTSMCRGYYFSFCNSSAATSTENAGQRNKARNAGLPNGKGDKCNNDSASNAQDFGYIHYHFGKTSSMTDCQKKKNCGLQKNDIRKC